MVFIYTFITEIEYKKTINLKCIFYRINTQCVHEKILHMYKRLKSVLEITKNSTTTNKT